MEQSSFILAAAVAIIFAIAKFVENKYILKEEHIAFKNIIRDCLMVYVSTVMGLFVIEQVGETVIKQSPTVAFTGKADF
jgi:hypothetical protein